MKMLLRAAIAVAAFAVMFSNAHANATAYFGDTTGVMSQSNYYGGTYGYVWTTLTSPSGKLYQDTKYQPNAIAGVSNTSVVYNEPGTWTLKQYNKQGTGGTVNLSSTSYIDVLAKTAVITTSSSPSNGGSTSGGGTLNIGSNCTVTGNPAGGGYSFRNWTEGGSVVSSSASYSFTVNAARTLVANFDLPKYQILTWSVTGSGTVSPLNGSSYLQGTTIQVTASAGTGYHLSSWGGALAGTSTSTNPASLLMNADKNVTATFSPNSYQVTTTTTGSGFGSVSGAGSYAYGTTPSFTASPSTGSYFAGWSNAASGTTNPVGVFIDGNKTLTATFTLYSYTVGTAMAGAGSGTVSGGGTYNYGSSATMTATPAAGSYFNGWSGPISGGTNPQGFMVTGNTTVTATFALYNYTVTTGTSPAGLGTVSGGGSYTYGQTANLTAPSVTGYTFTGWSSGGLSGTTNPIGLAVAGNTTVIANYTINSYTLATNVSGSGSVTPGGTYAFGAKRTIFATPAIGYHFTGWTGDVTGAGNPVDVVVDRAKTLTANFAPNIATVTVPSVSYTYDGSEKRAAVTTSPESLRCEVTYDGSATAPSQVGEYEVVATVTDPNYQGKGTGRLSIVQAVPKTTWPRPVAITYPAPLSSAQLNASADIAGTFSYAPAAGAILGPGAGQVLNATFTPNDGRNHRTVDISNTIDVSAAVQTVAVSPASSTVKAGGRVTFTASGGMNGYSWGGQASGTGDSQTVVFPLPGIFEVSVFSPSGTPYLRSNTATAGINVEAVAQSVSLAPVTVLIEPNRSITLTAGGGMNGYLWGGSANGSGSTKTLSFATPGNYGITVRSPAGGAFLESNVATAQVTVAVAQTINFPPPGSFVLRAVGTNLLANASSGLPVRFTVVSGPGTLAGLNYLRFSSLGAIVVQADQDGDATYAPAPPVRQTIPVNAPPVTTLQFPSGKTGLILGEHQDTNQALPQPK